MSLDRSRLVVVFLDDFEDISVWVAKEEANERCFTYRFDQRCTLACNRSFNRGNSASAHVTAMWRPNSFSNRDGSNSGSSIKCSSIPGAISSQAASCCDISRAGHRLPTQRILEEIYRSLHVARRQSDVCQSHGIGPGYSWVVNFSRWSS